MLWLSHRACTFWGEGLVYRVTPWLEFPWNTDHLSKVNFFLLLPVRLKKKNKVNFFPKPSIFMSMLTELSLWATTHHKGSNVLFQLVSADFQVNGGYLKEICGISLSILPSCPYSASTTSRPLPSKGCRSLTPCRANASGHNHLSLSKNWNSHSVLYPLLGAEFLLCVFCGQVPIT